MVAKWDFSTWREKKHSQDLEKGQVESKAIMKRHKVNPSPTKCEILGVNYHGLKGNHVKESGLALSILVI